MIWLWAYLASILPAIIASAFMLGRDGCFRRVLGPAAVTVGVFWPLVAPAIALCVAIEWAAARGAASSEQGS